MLYLRALLPGDAGPCASLARCYDEPERRFVRDFSGRLLHKIVDGAIGQRETNERPGTQRASTEQRIKIRRVL